MTTRRHRRYFFHQSVNHAEVLDHGFDALASLSFGTQKVARPHLDDLDGSEDFVQGNLERWADRRFKFAVEG